MTHHCPDIAALSFEAALQELEKIVKSLEAGSISLQDSITAYERGITLKNHCEAILKDATLKIEKLTLSADDKPVALEVEKNGGFSP